MEAASLSLTPHGRLILIRDADAPRLDDELRDRLLPAFDRGSGHGLLLLGADEPGTALPPVYSFWREFGAKEDGGLEEGPQAAGEEVACRSAGAGTPACRLDIGVEACLGAEGSPSRHPLPACRAWPSVAQQ